MRTKAIAAPASRCRRGSRRPGRRAPKSCHRFGPAVTAIVDGLYRLRIRPQAPRGASVSEAYIARLRTAPRSVQLVSGCDKLHNVRSIVMDYRTHGEAFWTDLQRRVATARSGFMNAVRDALRTGEVPAVVAELDRALAERISDSPCASA